MPELDQKVAQALSDMSAREARRDGTHGIRERVPAALERYPEIQSRVRAIKERALARLPELVNEAENHLLAHGFHVFRADDAEAARQYVLSHTPPESLIIKSKSNLAKEMHLPEALEAHGHRLVETDLGDHINQLLGRRSGHVLMPALGVDIPTIQHVFRERFDEPEIGPEPTDLVQAARRHLRPLLESATVSVSGANAVTAAGEIVLMENEGNIRAVTSLPSIHFVIVGVHKVVETLEEGLAVVQAASLYGIGQDLGNYCTILAGPGRDAGPEVHVVLVDDGRLKAIAQEPEPFYCINCGSCLNVCPVYAEMGESYGGERLGGIGIMQTFLLDGAEQATADGLDLCLGCQRCIPACPSAIDTPGITNRLKASRAIKPHAAMRRRFLRLVLSRGELTLARAVFGTSAQLGISRRWHRRGQRAEDFIPVPDRTRPIPAGASFPAIHGARGTVWLYPGCVMDAWYAGIHEATIAVLMQNGFTVRIPATKTCCGALHAHAGEPDPLPELLAKNAAAFPGEDPIIMNSAGCGAFLKQHEGPLQARVRDLSEFLLEAGLKPPSRPIHRRVAYHNPCHLRFAQGIHDAPQALLQAVGYALVPVDEREACCASAGTYNLEFPTLAWRLAREKAEDLTQGQPDVIATANPGCLMQIRAGVESLDGQMAVVHWVELLREAYGGVRS